MTIPNWFIHVKWASRAGISEATAHVVNRIIDYGSFSTFFMIDKDSNKDVDNPQYYELKYMHDKEPVTGEFVKAYILHLVLDHFKETRHKDFTKAIDEFLAEKVLSEIQLPDGSILSFGKELEEIITFVKENKTEILDDVHGACY